jgi:ubiquinone/menaquinone biosynthesis C-methylase UbiE
MTAFVANDPAGYEIFMARWTQRLARPFLDFTGIRPGQRVLDVGCGTGVITAAAADLVAMAVGLDMSGPYIDFARRERTRPNASYELGDAHHIRHPDASFDAALSTLALDVIPDAEAVINEMRRVTRHGGTIASAIHDFRGAFAPIFMFLDIASTLDRCAQTIRDEMLSHPLVWPQGQTKMWQAVGLVQVVEVPLVIQFDFASFADYWASFETGQGRAGAYLTSLDEEHCKELTSHVHAAYLGGRDDGPRSFSVIIRAARGIVP